MKKMRDLLAGILSLALSSFVTACGSGGGSNATPYNPYSGHFAANVLPVVVGDCGSNGYANEPCTEVQICTPGTSKCQTITNVLVDTGSYGLRIFSSQLNINLNPVKDAHSNPIAECAEFGTSNTWGSIQSADVVLSGEPAVTVPIQVIDANYETVPSGCDSPDASAAEAGYNGILGVGLLAQDCGTECVSNADSGFYYSCNSGTCAGTKLSLDQQVVNPVAKLPTDNNGVILDLPAVPDGGSASVIGTLTLGIGTESNNSPGSVQVYSADAAGDFDTKFSGKDYSSSFIDSGSNGLFFPATTSLATCGGTTSYADFYCPDSELSFKATQSASDGSKSVDVAFNVTNAQQMLANYGPIVGAFNNLGGTEKAAFDWGLPFFFGRKVYVGLSTSSSSLATGPYWAW